MSEITQQEKVKKLLNEGIRSHVISGIIKEQGNLYEWLQCAPIVFGEYLKLHEENQRLREALEFYANIDNHEVFILDYRYPKENVMILPVEIDMGEIARELLKEHKE